MTFARSTLERLLAAGERARARGSPRRPSQRFGDRGSAYWSLGIEQRDATHAELRRAAESGAVDLEWSRFGGEDRTLEVVRLRELEKLAAFLGLPTHAVLVAQAVTAFEPWLERVPKLERVLDAWSALKKVRQRGPDAALEFVDAARVISFMARHRDDAVVRVVSRRLFRDSKRIEALTPLLDVLTSDSLAAPPAHAEDVLAAIGLRKAPVPFMVAGVGEIHLAVSGPRQLAYEYLAVNPGQVLGYSGAPRWALCIENLTTFELVARRLPHGVPALILYTGGMPSPSWRRALVTVLAAIPDVPVYHWGDIDEGGFRIAAVIAHALRPRPLLPWLMDPTDVDHADVADPSERARMARHAGKAGWTSLATAIAAAPPRTIEQEGLSVVLPPTPSDPIAPTSHARYLTKSRFALALTCPHKLAYGDDPRYASSRTHDAFLQALAEGGHQVGALAKSLFTGGIEITERDRDAAAARTRALLDEHDEIVLFEAAICIGRLYVRIDLLRKAGDFFELYEVKAKSVDGRAPPERVFLRDDGTDPTSAYAPYLYDVAFQRHVLRRAFPKARVSSFLVCVDKSRTSSEGRLPQRLPIHRAGARVTVTIEPSLHDGRGAREILAILPMDRYCDLAESRELEAGGWGFAFGDAVATFAHQLEAQEFSRPRLGAHCRRCEFTPSPEQRAERLRDGRTECWSTQLGLPESRFVSEATVLDLHGRYDVARAAASGRVLLAELTPADVKLGQAEPRITLSSRQWLQCQEARRELGGPYLLRDQVAAALARLAYPLHFVDFETTSPALPFHPGCRPYELVFFQFSHHVREQDGAIAHRNQVLIDDGPGNPTIDVVRALRSALGDRGSVVHWWTHERTVLTHARAQIDRSVSPDRDALLAFVDSLLGTEQAAPRLVDLGQHIVRPFVFLPRTRGSSSLKLWLPALLPHVPGLRARLRATVYGSQGGIASLNFRDLAWVQETANGVRDPYDILRELGADVFDVALADAIPHDGDVVADGGAAMVAYALLQSPLTDAGTRIRLRRQLHRYCELDSFAMAMAYEGLLELLGVADSRAML